MYDSTDVADAVNTAIALAAEVDWEAVASRGKAAIAAEVDRIKGLSLSPAGPIELPYTATDMIYRWAK